MRPTPIVVPAELVELLDEAAALSLPELARGCRVTTQWVHAHVEAGVLHPAGGNVETEWRFAAATLTRARRIAELEDIYDADPHLAALAADLMEEVARLRGALAGLK